MDPCAADPNAGFGFVVEHPQARITRLSEEHGQIDITACDHPPKLGERITVSPNHICPCFNLQNHVWWFDPEENLQPQQLKVDARGELV